MLQHSVTGQLNVWPFQAQQAVRSTEFGALILCSASSTEMCFLPCDVELFELPSVIQQIMLATANLLYSFQATFTHHEVGCALHFALAESTSCFLSTVWCHSADRF